MSASAAGFGGDDTIHGDTMFKKSLLALAVLTLAASSAVAADEPRIELSLNLGGTASSGINSNEVAPSGQSPVYMEVRPKNGFSFGGDLGYFLTEKIQVGALYSNQKSELQFTGPNSWVQVGEGLDVQNYMGTVAFHTGDFWQRTRFYVLGGIGATRYGNVTILGINGSAVVGGRTKFASTWGVGVKHTPNDRLGVKLGVRWTPTYLGETADEWVCSPYWPQECSVSGTNSQFAHQIEGSVGVMIRF
jgi:opacity protein-like surface antigen